VSLNDVSHGDRTIITLNGLDSAGTVIAQGRTCSINFTGAGTTAPLYFAPTNFFALTASDPITVRQDPVAMALGDGRVLLAGGGDPTSATVFDSSELFAPGLATFAAHTAVMNHARTRAQATPLSSIGLLVTGGVDAAGTTLAEAELYLESGQQFLRITAPLLDGRVDHRAVVLPDGSAFISGGRHGDADPPLATTLFVAVNSDGTYQVTAGPPLLEARRSHATVVSVGVPVVFGGYGAAGTVLDTIEAVDRTSGAAAIGKLKTARAEATASLLADGSILIVGGIGPASTPLADAEVFNPITHTTNVQHLAVARSGHTATVLSDGRVLIAGGLGQNKAALDSVELFVADLGFVTERSLLTPRSGHVTIPLCDGTALVVGGGEKAELYSGPAD
jgi:hypothetical protein